MRRYGELVEVRSRGSVPVRFRWRGRVYLVRAVLARWIERGSWWAAPGSLGRTIDTLEREVWRVEAVAGPAVGVYDLVRDLPGPDPSGSDPSGSDPSGSDPSDADLPGVDPAHSAATAERWRLARSLD